MSRPLITQMLWEVAKAKKNSGVEMQLEVLIREKERQTVRESAHFCKEAALVSIDVSGTLVMWA